MAETTASVTTKNRQRSHTMSGQVVGVDVRDYQSKDGRRVMQTELQIQCGHPKAVDVTLPGPKNEALVKAAEEGQWFEIIISGARSLGFNVSYIAKEVRLEDGTLVTARALH